MNSGARWPARTTLSISFVTPARGWRFSARPSAERSTSPCSVRSHGAWRRRVSSLVDFCIHPFARWHLSYSFLFVGIIDYFYAMRKRCGTLQIFIRAPLVTSLTIDIFAHPPSESRSVRNCHGIRQMIYRCVTARDPAFRDSINQQICRFPLRHTFRPVVLKKPKPTRLSPLFKYL